MPVSPSLDSRTLDSFRHYQRALARWLDQRGIVRVDRVLSLPCQGEDRKATHEIWLRDSLLWAFEEAERGEIVHALRGLLQAAGYAGAVGHDSTTQDAYLTLRNHLEDALGKRAAPPAPSPETTPAH